MIGLAGLQLVSCLTFRSHDLRAIGAMVRGTMGLDSARADVRAVTDEGVCARLAAAVGRKGAPVYAARVGAYFGVVPAGRNELPDEITIVDSLFRVVPARRPDAQNPSRSNGVHR